MLKVAAGIALQLLAADVPVESPAISVSEEYYDVAGTSARELQAAVAKAGPRGGRYGGEAVWKVVWSYGPDRKDDSCAVAWVVVAARVTVTLPRWTNAAEASEDLRLEWNLLMRDLKRHEQVHVDNGIAVAKGIDKALRALPAAASCSDLEADVARTANAIVDDGQRRDAAFDLRSAHGMADLGKR